MIRLAMANDWRDRLRQEIDARGIKVTRLSTDLGFNRDYITRVLNGSHEPSLGKMRAICDQIGINLGDLIYGRDRSAREAEIIRALADLTDDEAARYLRILQAIRDERR